MFTKVKASPMSAIVSDRRSRQVVSFCRLASFHNVKCKESLFTATLWPSTQSIGRTKLRGCSDRRLRRLEATEGIGFVTWRGAPALQAGGASSAGGGFRPGGCATGSGMCSGKGSRAPLKPFLVGCDGLNGISWGYGLRFSTFFSLGIPVG